MSGKVLSPSVVVVKLCDLSRSQKRKLWHGGPHFNNTDLLPSFCRDFGPVKGNDVDVEMMSRLLRKVQKKKPVMVRRQTDEQQVRRHNCRLSHSRR